MKRNVSLFYFAILISALFVTSRAFAKPRFFKAGNSHFKYVGRVDFRDPQKPRFWSPGVYITTKFKGPSCRLLINDEELFGKTHNYIEIVIDGKPSRIQTTGETNNLQIAKGLGKGWHTLLICKDTESGMGYLEFVGLVCEKITSPVQPKRMIEYIGDSITAGAGLDASQVACGKGQWYDQHNAYLSYGARTSRALNAQWQLTAVAGIGLVHSCCNMDILLPQVYDKLYLRNDSLAYDFKQYQPDVVTICLGQNDGVQDSVKFCSEYVRLIDTVSSKYPQADIVCLSSPMANAELTAVLHRYLTGIVQFVNNRGDNKVSKFFFSRSFNSGCDAHPDANEHAIIAGELTAYLKKLKGW
ncbi:SGNH/GDSL hydrolase family protein [Mucilaginibacter sp. 14171R-50]|uniref:SGNH/GDSL hydrolase family protein n=1 Tax=Mucilaginibacter sp. 14171R-50 TaxID=2703789 RepID=UPI00138BF52B|nr:SGNH/GDSL hydrolase family protein [Mucilaginibacter sp. 14171R-50]QHS55042.1 SGNH/GDSL hydrolase family protein [Mucilaginibacter sp. 14171R-50]